MKAYITDDPDISNAQCAERKTKFNFGALLKRWLNHPFGDGPRPALGNFAKVRGRLFIRFRDNSKHRRRLAFMLHHFHVDPDFATSIHWPELRRAGRICFGCSNTRRCDRWIEQGGGNDAPRVFCPLASLLDEIAGGEQQRSAA